VIQASKGATLFDGIQSTGFFHHENGGSVPFRIQTNLAKRAFGDISALGAEGDPFLHITNGIRQSKRLFLVGFHEMKGQPLSSFLPNARQPHEFPAETSDKTLRLAIEPVFGRSSGFEHDRTSLDG
jgi:hypothetical protein